MSLDWDKLKIFYAVAKAGTLTGAGKELELSQSVISRHISGLEDAMSVTLFRRHARGLILTEQGEILFKTAEDIAQKILHTSEAIHDTLSLPEGPLKITVSEFIGCTWLMPRIARFRQKHSKIQLSIIMDNKYLNINMKEADAGIRLGSVKDEELIAKKLTSIDFHICASKQYLEAYGTPTTTDELQEHYLIGYPRGSDAPYEDPNWFLEHIGAGPKTKHKILRVNSMYAIQKAAITGGGIAALPKYIIDENKDLEIILPDIKPPSVDMFFVHTAQQHNSKRIELFYDFLSRNIKKTNFYTSNII